MLWLIIAIAKLNQVSTKIDDVPDLMFVVFTLFVHTPTALQNQIDIIQPNLMVLASHRCDKRTKKKTNESDTKYFTLVKCQLYLQQEFNLSFECAHSHCRRLDVHFCCWLLPVSTICRVRRSVPHARILRALSTEYSRLNGLLLGCG